jgi:hypothetical protein
MAALSRLSDCDKKMTLGVQKCVMLLSSLMLLEERRGPELGSERRSRPNVQWLRLVYDGAPRVVSSGSGKPQEPSWTQGCLGSTSLVHSLMAARARASASATGNKEKDSW